MSIINTLTSTPSLLSTIALTVTYGVKATIYKSIQEIVATTVILSTARPTDKDAAIRPTVTDIRIATFRSASTKNAIRQAVHIYNKAIPVIRKFRNFLFFMSPTNITSLSVMANTSASHCNVSHTDGGGLKISGTFLFNSTH